MVRDRLTELQRKSLNTGKNDTKSNDVLIEMENNDLKNTFELAESILQDLQQISLNIEQCELQIKQIRESPFKEKEIAANLAHIFQKNNALVQNVKTNLNKLQKFAEKSNTSNADGRIKLVQFNTLNTRFRECILKNNEEMEKFKNLRIGRFKAQLLAKGVHTTDEEFQSLLEDSTSSNVQIFNDNHLIDTADARRLLMEAEELNKDLLKIEKMLTEIRDLFVQTAVLVEEQQDLINVIEYQALQTVDYVSKTPAILQKARNKKKKAAKMKHICILFVILF